MQRTLTQELQERGLVYQFSTENLEEILESKKRKGYLGVDPSADSMHIGNLVAYILAQHLKNHGHEMILLVGGATGLVGDPSFKEEERDVVSEEVIQDRAKKIAQQIENIVGLDKMKIVNNYDWFKNMNTMTFLREVGKHFNVGTMIKRESVKKRIEGENGISYAEFSYSLIQGYDYYHLYKEEGCDLQIGGSDQWGNIISGVDYIRRKAGETTYAMTLPLIIDSSSGKKFGKSEGNAVWLDPKKTTPYEFYQFWINTSDEASVDLLKKFTFLSLEEIDEITKEAMVSPELRKTQKTLAYEVTKFVHGKDIADSVVKVTEILFNDDSLEGITETVINMILQEAHTYEITEDTNLVDLLIKTDLASSKREAREFIENGAITLSDNNTFGVETIVEVKTLDRLNILKRGKKKMCILVANE